MSCKMIKCSKCREWFHVGMSMCTVVLSIVGQSGCVLHAIYNVFMVSDVNISCRLTTITFCVHLCRDTQFLAACNVRSAWPAGPKIYFAFSASVSIYIYLCASALIMCTIITSHTLLPWCHATLLELIDFNSLDGCFV